MTWRGKRYRVPANEYAIPRMEPGKQRPIQSMEEARDWERRFIGEVKAGRDPRRPPSPPKPREGADRRTSRRSSTPTSSAARSRQACAASRPSEPTAGLKEQLGDLPLEALEDPDEINRFKAESDYAEELEIATIHRVLERLRAAMNWGMAQTPPLFKKSPFHRFGVRMNKKAGDGPRPAGLTGRGEAVARHGAPQDEQRRAHVRR